MRLLNTENYHLQEFTSELETPGYAIFSHTWEDEEVLFDDLEDLSRAETKKGYKKFSSFCRQAQQDGYTWVWIDNCCIDKSSSAELSEAINSMFRWYEYSQVCYTYLADAAGDKIEENCRWVFRGWTLQELIAPSEVLFYNRDWRFLGRKTGLAAELAEITTISIDLLSYSFEYVGVSMRGALNSFSVATRMAWASMRTTTRVEDAAYSLMGIFEVNMPLLYGEGTNSFQRLQQEIINKSDDTSILAFTANTFNRFLLASHPSDFKDILLNVHNIAGGKSSISLGKSEININILLCPANNPQDPNTLFYAIFDCCFEKDYLARPAILLKKIQKNPQWFTRLYYSALYCISRNQDRSKVTNPTYSSKKYYHTTDDYSE